MDAQQQELLQLSRDLLQSIADLDWDRYHELCDDSLTAFEPEAGALHSHVHVQAAARTQGYHNQPSQHVQPVH
jgi:hypothetical protein